MTPHLAEQPLGVVPFALLQSQASCEVWRIVILKEWLAAPFLQADVPGTAESCARGSHPDAAGEARLCRAANARSPKWCCCASVCCA